MRTLLYIATALAVIGLAFWAYRENYLTQASADRVRGLHGEIADTRARLAVLRAEWAYLNRPDRLQELADLNFTRLGLLPMTAEQFGRVDEVAFPAPQLHLPSISSSVEVMNREPLE